MNVEFPGIGLIYYRNYAITMSKKEVLGLLVVFIVYVMIGGAVFMALEGPLEGQLRSELSQLRDDFRVKLVWLNHPNFTRDDFELLLHQLAVARSKNLIDENGNDTHINWNFYNSFFFAITVVTTIGYGHLAPSTASGRIFCMLYAMIGIPMTGILLAAIGDHFSKNLLRSLDKARKHYTSKVAVLLNGATFLLPWLVVFMVLPAGIFMLIEEWSYLEGIYYCFISLSTIGFGDYVAGNFEGDYIWIYKSGVVLWIIFGLGYLAMILNYISRAMRCKHIRRMEHRLSTSFHHTQQKFGQRIDEIQHILQEFAAKQKPTKKTIPQTRSFPCTEDKQMEFKVPIHDKNHNKDIQLQRLITLVESLKEESNLNLYPPHYQSKKCYNFRPSVEHSNNSPPSGLVPGTDAPSRRHSMPVQLAPPEETSVLDVKSSAGQKNKSHMEFSTTFGDGRAFHFPFASMDARHELDETDDEIEDSYSRPIVSFDLESLESTNV